LDQGKGLIGNLEKKGEVIQAKIQQKFERKLGSRMRRLLPNKKRLPVAKNGYLPFPNVAWQKQEIQQVQHVLSDLYDGGVHRFHYPAHP